MKNKNDNTYSNSSDGELSACLVALSLSSPDAIVSIDATGNIIQWNNAAEKNFGYKRSEILKKNITTVIPKRYKDKHQKSFMRHLSTGEKRIIGSTVELAGLRKDGTEFPLELSLSEWSLGGSRYFTGIMRDISWRKEAEKQLKSTIAFEQTVSSISSRFISSTDIEKSIDISLKELGQLSKACRAYLFQFSDDLNTMSNINEWCDKDVDPHIDNLQDVSLEDFSWTKGKMLNKEIVQVNDMDKLPNDAAYEREEFKRENILSIVYLPVVVNKTVFGFIGLDCTTKNSIWSKRDVTLLRIASEIIGSSLEKKEAYDQISETNHLNRSLNEINDILHSSLNFEKVSETVLRKIMKIVDADSLGLIFSNGDQWEMTSAIGILHDLEGKKFSESEAVRNLLISYGKEPTFVSDMRENNDLRQEVFSKLGHSFLSVPIYTKNKQIGAIIILYNNVEKKINLSRIDFHKKLASSIALARENSVLYEGEKRVAETLQHTLLKIPQELDDVDFYTTYHSASIDLARVGGDFFDIFEIQNNTIGILIGDVSGKGLPAATLTSQIKSAVKAYAFKFRSASKVVELANDFIIRTSDLDTIVTLFFGILDKGTGILHFCSAGQPEGIVRRKNDIEILHSKSPALGIYNFFTFIDEEIILHRGDTLIIYTDGVIEARNENEFFGSGRLKEITKNTSNPSPKRLCVAIDQKVMAFSRSILKDDFALLAISRKRQLDSVEDESEVMIEEISMSKSVKQALTTLVESLVDLLGVSGVAFFSIDKKIERLVGEIGSPEKVWPHIKKVAISLDDENSWAAESARSCGVISIDDAASEPKGKKWLVSFYKTKSLLFLPMLAHDEVIGVIVAIDTKSNRAFSEDEKNAALLLVSRAAMIISEEAV